MSQKHCLSSPVYLTSGNMWRAPSLSRNLKWNVLCLAHVGKVLTSCPRWLQMSCGAIWWWEKLQHIDKSVGNSEFGMNRKQERLTKDSHANCSVKALRFSSHVHYKYTHLHILRPVLHPGGLQNGHDRLSGLKTCNFLFIPPMQGLMEHRGIDRIWHQMTMNTGLKLNHR